tara:strand:+ start:298 stop:993 length:696 start_codon:yes stop_codon:yes gene_type:complete
MFLPLINDDKKFVVFWNAKAGCTAVKRWYLSTVGIDPDTVNPHKFLASKQSYFNQFEVKRRLESDYYTFIVARNPWKRIVSYYKNKKVEVGWKNTTWPIDVRIRDMNSENFSFRDLVEFVCKTPDNYLEQHLQSQTSQLDGVRFDNIVRLENYKNGMEKVCDILDISQRDFRNTNKSKVTSNKELVCDLRPSDFSEDNMPTYECFYDEELKNKVAKKFAKDIQFFNYNFED